MLDVSRKVVPDKGRLNRELETKALKFPFCTHTHTNSFELEHRAQEGVHIET